MQVVTTESGNICASYLVSSKKLFFCLLLSLAYLRIGLCEIWWWFEYMISALMVQSMSTLLSGEWHGTPLKISQHWFRQRLVDVPQEQVHYLNHCWPRSLLPYAVTSPQSFKAFEFGTYNQSICQQIYFNRGLQCLKISSCLDTVEVVIICFGKKRNWKLN